MAEEDKNRNIKVKNKNLLHRIVNVFLYTGIGLLLLLVIVFAVSQTSLFKEYLREIVLKEANSALNGKVYFEKIEGTLFTSVLLRNVSVAMEKDTLLKAETIEVKISPLRMLLKNIYVRKFELKNASVSLVRDSSGELNISRLFPPSEEDSTSSEFPFTLQVADFRFTSVDFSLKDFTRIGPDAENKFFDIDNLVIRDVNMSLNAFANIKQNQFVLGINKFSFRPNITSFNVENISGGFYVDEEKITVRDLNVKTGRSDFDLNSEAENFNLFDTTGTSDFSEAFITLDLDAEKFSFDDLSAILPSVDILSGALATKIKAIGTLKDLSLKQLETQFYNTRFRAAGRIQHIDEPSEMLINAEFDEMIVDQSDLNKLLPSLSVPVFEEYGIVSFDTLQFAGHPTDFSTKLFMRTDKGNISAEGKMNFNEERMAYDLNVRTENLDISPVAEIHSDINSQIYMLGKGTNPENLDAKIDFKAASSSVNGYTFDLLTMNAGAASKKINYNLSFLSDSAFADVSGMLDFTSEENPAYELRGEFNNIDLAEIIKDSSARTNLNFRIDAAGSNFNPDDLNLFLTLNLFNSSYMDASIDSTRAILDIRKEDNGNKVINLISDLADVTLAGRFNIPETAQLISEEINVLSGIVNSKMEEMMLNGDQERLNVKGSDVNAAVIPAAQRNVQKKIYRKDIDQDLEIEYAVDLKDFSLLSYFLGGSHLEIDGDIQGSLRNEGDSVYFSFNSNLPYIKYWGDEDVYFLSHMDLSFSLANSFDSKKLTDILSFLKFKTERIFTGSDIYDVNFNLQLEGKSFPVSFSGQLENNASVNFNGDLMLNGTAGLNLDSLILTYNGLTFRNNNDIVITLEPDRLNLENFSLSRDSGEIRINGSISQNQNQDLKIELININGKEICTYLLDLRPENSLDAEINLVAELTGSLNDPEINLSLDAEDISFKGRNFGSLLSSFKYKDKNLDANARFVKTPGSSFSNVNNMENILLEISGKVPIDLSLSGETGKLSEENEVQITLKADGFNLGAFGDVLPSLDKLEGILSADLELRGLPPDNISPSGFLEIKDASFISEANNMEYQTGLKIRVEPGSLTFDNLYIQNTEGTRDGGKMTGSGKLSLKGFEIAASEFAVNGRLKVLSDASKSVSPSVYGDLVIETNGNVFFRSEGDGSYLEAPVGIVVAELNFPPSRSAYASAGENFIYKFAVREDSVKEEPGFEKLVELSRSRNQKTSEKPSLFSNLDYKIDITVEEEATIIFVLSKEFNQNLTAVLKGDFELQKTGGRPIALGELELLEGSTLEFIKTLDAEGSIKFEADLSNPILDITATYTDYYYPDSSGTEAVPDEGILVAVKIKLEGPLKELDKKLIQGEDNILVYIGEQAIENDEPDRTKDASDAVMFMILGKFQDEASQQDINQANSYAASVAGSIVGSFLNNQTNGVIKSVEVRQAGSNTYVNFGGRFGDFTYEFGTTTESFNDLSQANFKIKYPITKKLIGKIERKRALNETSITREMVNEIGLRYRFEF